MIAYAMQNKVLIFGICRGQQKLNVANGETLIPDILTYKPDSKLNHRIKTTDAHITVAIQNKWLNTYLNIDTFGVNSRITKL
jgi:gamma-glutamyl-gamma-aminobutyrate hydrolase PuuD